MRLPLCMCLAANPSPGRCPAQARTRLQRVAKALAFATLAYCLAEGVLSVTLAARGRSISLCIFGLDSLIEVASACLVLWRLFGNALDLRRERAAVLAIGGNTTSGVPGPVANLLTCSCLCACKRPQGACVRHHVKQGRRSTGPACYVTTLGALHYLRQTFRHGGRQVALRACWHLVTSPTPIQMREGRRGVNCLLIGNRNALSSLFCDSVGYPLLADTEQARHLSK